MSYDIRCAEEKWRDGRTSWFAEHPQLPGCHAVGGTLTEATKYLDEVRPVWLRFAEEHGFPIPPEPVNTNVTIEFLDESGEGK